VRISQRPAHAEADLLRHFVVYRVVDEETIEVLRLLHDRMELPRHLDDLKPTV
jgi:plasmid stabilization system protein ParE